MNSIVARLREDLEARGECVKMANATTGWFAVYRDTWRDRVETARNLGREGPNLVVYRTTSDDPRDHDVIPYSVARELLVEDTLTTSAAGGSQRWNLTLKAGELHVTHRPGWMDVSKHHGTRLLVEEGGIGIAEARTAGSPRGAIGIGRGRRDALVYWKASTVAAARAKDLPLRYAASAQLRRLGPGDIAWIVTMESDELLLVGRLAVAEIVDRRTAEKRLGTTDLWEASDYALAAADQAAPLGRVRLDSLSAKLEVDGRGGGSIADADGRVNPQRLQTLRFITSASGALLERAWRRRAGSATAWPRRGRTAEPSSRVLVEGRTYSRADLGETLLTDATWPSSGPFDPDGVVDHRRRVAASIVLRRGQRAFRDALLVAYDGRCAVTGCRAKAVLEAAHIHGYLGDESDKVTNGLLLRSDLHTLFDLGLLAIEPATGTVKLARVLLKTEYAEYDGRPIRLPKNPRAAPSKRALQRHLEWSRL